MSKMGHYGAGRNVNRALDPFVELKAETDGILTGGDSPLY